MTTAGFVLASRLPSEAMSDMPMKPAPPVTKTPLPLASTLGTSIPAGQGTSFHFSLGVAAQRRDGLGPRHEAEESERRRRRARRPHTSSWVAGLCRCRPAAPCRCSWPRSCGACHSFVRSRWRAMPAAQGMQFFRVFWLFWLLRHVAFAKQRAATSWFRYRSAALRRASRATAA